MIPLEVWLVVSLQVVLGLADVAVHHELIARLPWRSGAAPELRLHGARNLVYAVIFLMLAWILPLGWTAWILAGLLLAEAAITFSLAQGSARAGSGCPGSNGTTSYG